jgi:HK97 family phage prohead protease
MTSTLDRTGLEEGFRTLVNTHDVDERTHRVTVDFPHDVVDGLRTSWAPGCFDESLNRRLPPMCYEHNKQSVIGRATSWKSLGNRTRLVGKFADFDDVPRAREAFSLIRDGIVPGFSFHFRNGRTVRHPTRQGVRSFIKADLLEYGPTPWPAIPGAEAVDIRSALGGRSLDDEIELRIARLGGRSKSLDDEIEERIERLGGRGRSVLSANKLQGRRP